MTEEVWVLLVLLVVLPAGFALALWQYFHRIKVTQQWAAAVGWQYVGTDPALVNRWHGQPFGVGRSRRVSELVVGRYRGRAASSFRYTYRTGSGKNSSTHTFHVVAVASSAYLPTLELTREGLGARLAKTFGGQDIQFESEDFNRAWRVRADDAKFAHDIVHPRLMERLLRPDAEGVSLRIEGQDILSWASGAPRLDVVAGRVGVLCAILDCVPRYVWLDHGYDPDAQLPG